MSLSLDLPEIENLAKDYFKSIQNTVSFIGMTAGVSMGKLGNYPFFMHTNDYKVIEESLSAEFGSYKPIKGQEVLSDSGGWSGTIRLNGVLVAQSLHALKPLEWYLKNREPIRFTTLAKDINVVVTNLTTSKRFFVTTGAYRVQDFNITLKEVFDELV